VVARARAQARPGVGHRQIVDAGHDLPGAFQHGIQTARRHVGIEALFFARRADEEPTVLLGRQVGIRPAHDVLQLERAPHVEFEHLPFDGPHRRTLLGLQPLDLARPRPRRHDDTARLDPLALLGDERRGLVVGHDGLDGRLLVQLSASLPECRPQRIHEPAVVDLVVRRSKHRCG
jgi:hypothetical protein